MNPEHTRRNSILLGILIALGMGYLGLLRFWGTLTGIPNLDGAIGALFGLYICAHPAANMLDILLFTSADSREQILTTHFGRFWLTLNALTLLAGWVDIFTGVTRFVLRTGS